MRAEGLCPAMTAAELLRRLTRTSPLESIDLLSVLPCLCLFSECHIHSYSFYTQNSREPNLKHVMAHSLEAGDKQDGWWAEGKGGNLL